MNSDYDLRAIAGDGFNISPEDMWEKSIKEKLTDAGYLLEKHDPEFTRTTDKILNLVPSLFITQNYKAIAEELNLLLSVIQNPSYITNALLKAPDDVKKTVENLAQELSNFITLVSYEKPDEKEKTPPARKPWQLDDQQLEALKQKDKEPVKARKRLPN